MLSSCRWFFVQVMVVVKFDGNIESPSPFSFKGSNHLPQQSYKIIIQFHDIMYNGFHSHSLITLLSFRYIELTLTFIGQNGHFDNFIKKNVIRLRSTFCAFIDQNFKSVRIIILSEQKMTVIR